MKAFIVDDEEISRNVLKHMLQHYCPAVQVMGESSEFVDAVLQIEKTMIDVLFLDVELGAAKTGFNILEALRDFKGAVIFVTAHQNYAFNAYKHAAIDYILKPIDPIELCQAIVRVTKFSGLTAPAVNEVEEPRIALPYKRGLELVDPNSILYVQANGSYSKIYLEHEKIIGIAKNLKFIIIKLEKFNQFIRIHKSYIINKNRITGYLKTNGGTIELDKSIKIPISPTYKDNILPMFTNI